MAWARLQPHPRCHGQTAACTNGGIEVDMADGTNLSGIQSSFWTVSGFLQRSDIYVSERRLDVIWDINDEFLGYHEMSKP